MLQVSIHMYHMYILYLCTYACTTTLIRIFTYIRMYKCMSVNCTQIQTKIGMRTNKSYRKGEQVQLHSSKFLLIPRLAYMYCRHTMYRLEYAERMYVPIDTYTGSIGTVDNTLQIDLMFVCTVSG